MKLIARISQAAMHGLYTFVSSCHLLDKGIEKFSTVLSKFYFCGCDKAPCLKAA